MKKNAMRTNLRQSILKSFGRYVAIAAIIMLGAGLFMGLLMSKSDMVETGQQFIDEQNMFDLRMVSNYGWSEGFVEKFEALPDVQDAEGLIYMDLIAKVGKEDDLVYRFYSIPENMNKLSLRGGRMPEKDDEILIDGFYANDSFLGKTVVLSQTNDEDSLESLRYDTFTIVGYVAAPLFMDMNRGTTSVGSGVLENIFYVPAEVFDVDYYTEINLTLRENHAIYTEEYNDYLDEAVDRMEPAAEKLSEERFHELKAEIEEEYEEGLQEYKDGLKEFEEGKAEAEQELADALQKLEDGEKELEENRQKLIDGEKEIEKGREQLVAANIQLQEKMDEFYATKEAMLPLIEAERKALDENYDAIKAAFESAQTAVGQAKALADLAASKVPVGEIEANNAELQAQIAAKQEALSQATDEQTRAQLQLEIDSLNAQLQINNGLLQAYREALAELDRVENENQPAIDAMAALDAAYAAIDAQEQQLIDGEKQLWAAQEEIWKNEKALDSAYNKLMVSWGLWGEGRDELEQGRLDYEEAKLEVEKELADAEAELKDAKEKLDEAREDIDSMEEPDLIILDRNSNVGYNNLDSSSDIVSGVSRVLPVFFLLVASLVCITTMTRMIDEERTQIGTLKALGYTNSEIMNKYLIYSGSGAVLGCGLGIVLGCTIFPMIIWEAYQIMLYIRPNLALMVNWPLAITIVVVYTALMLFVTWYSCRKTLEEEPAELIRPKAPDPGKKIFLESLPFWHKLSFLNKVTIRNIFRYRQRLAMMLVGIGGCTALLLTGFGLRDSVVNIVDYQFENITHYDINVYFRDEPNAKEERKFRNILKDSAEDALLYHQSSVELEFGDRVKEIYMISGGEELSNFLDLHRGDEPLSLPGKNEVVLSVGVAENLGIRVGDTVYMRNADLAELELTVSAIYDNHVYNYSIVQPETIEDQWGELPEEQMAFIKMQEGKDVHALGAAITELDYVMNVSVSEDLANMVGKMMQALDLVVMLIVVCAGLLAVIVLYNLTNININERIREIATIKVLGFNASETAAYVFKENLILTVVGSGFGLLLGILLLTFVMTQIKIDMVWFKVIIEPASYIWSTLLTMLSAIVVDFIFYFKLDKINMAEALKSVE